VPECERNVLDGRVFARAQFSDFDRMAERTAQPHSEGNFRINLGSIFLKRAPSGPVGRFPTMK
jgi:hypothetical protein